MEFFKTEDDIYLFIDRYDKDNMNKYTVDELKKIVNDLATAYDKIDGGRTTFKQFVRTRTKKTIIKEINAKVGDTTRLKGMLRICIGLAAKRNDLEEKKEALRNEGFLDTGTRAQILSRLDRVRNDNYRLTDLNIDSLREECKELGLDSGGGRDALIRRIRGYDIEQINEERRNCLAPQRRREPQQQRQTSDDNNLLGALGLGAFVGALGSAIFGHKKNTEEVTLRF